MLILQMLSLCCYRNTEATTEHAKRKRAERVGFEQLNCPSSAPILDRQ
jgi:hypothetical protein